MDDFERFIIDVGEKALKDEPLTLEEAVGILEVPDEYLALLVYKAQKVKDKFFNPSQVEFCSIINAKSGACSEDCKFCAQSKLYKTPINVYPLVPKDEIIEGAYRGANYGANRYCVVLSGRKASPEEVERIADAVYEIKKVEKIPIKAILAPHELRGYIIIEAYTPHNVDDLIRGIKHTRERVQGVVDNSEIDKYLETKPVITSLRVGTDVEVIAGPFKGMQAKVIRVDESKNEITIEILEAAYTLPITVNAEYVRELKKGE